MSLRQRMSSVSPSPMRAVHTSQLQPATLRNLLAASGEARASAATLPAANEVAPADDYDFDDATIQRRPVSGFAPRGSSESIPCFEDVTAIDSPGARVRPPASTPDTEITAVDAPAPDHVEASGPRPILGRPVIDVGTPGSLPALPAALQPEVVASRADEEETAFEGLSNEPERASHGVFADTVAQPARRAAHVEVGTGPQPFRPGGALYGESHAGPTPSPWGIPSVPLSQGAPISPWHVHAHAAFSPAQAAPMSVPPPPESTRRARAGRFALAACLFVVAFAGGAAVARATSASAPSPSHLWQTLRAHV